jgi:quercetin dioxygenase-like cupin family protein
MKIVNSLFISILFFATNSSCNLTELKPEPEKEQSVSNPFQKGNKITNANFTGTAYLLPLIAADSLNKISVGNVSFEPGARTNWHIHPAGQIILVLDGIGYYQEKGTQKRILRKGDALKCPPNVPHWHGASIDSSFVQIAITGREKGEPIWMEPVSEQEYRK